MDDETRTDNKKSPRDWLRVISRRWVLFALGASIFAIIVLTASLWWPVQYTGVAKFTRRMDPAAEQLVGSKSESFETRKLTLQNDLVGDKAIERAIEDLGLLKDLPRTAEGQLTPKGELEKQELVKKAKKNCKIDWEVRSEQVDLISVAYTDPRPEVAQEFPNTLVNNYFAWVSKQIIDRLSDSEAFLRDQRDKGRRQMETLTEERIKFEKAHAGAMPDRPGMLEEQIRKMDSDLEAIDRQLNIAQKKLNRLRGLDESATIASSQPTSMAGFNPEVAHFRKQLSEAREALKLMQTTKMDAHPSVLAQKKIISELERSLQEAQNTPGTGTTRPAYTMTLGSDPVMDQAMLQIEIDTLSKDKEKLQRWRDEQKALSKDLAPIFQEYDRINRKMRDKDDEMKKWDAQYLGVQMALSAESANKRTHHDSILVAQPQYRPSSPALIVVLGFAIVGGLGFGAALVFIAHTMDRSISTSEDAAKYFNLPVHGVIGRIVTPEDRRITQLKRWVLTPAIATVLLMALGVSTTSIVLWLQYPDQYKDWKRSPAGFVLSQLSAEK